MTHTPVDVDRAEETLAEVWADDDALTDEGKAARLRYTWLVASASAARRMARLSRPARRRLSTVDIRCPVRGCLLASILPITLYGQPMRVLYNERHPNQSTLLPVAWWPLSCRHGTAGVGLAVLRDAPRVLVPDDTSWTPQARRRL